MPKSSRDRSPSERITLNARPVVSIQPDPQFRLDILLMRLAELATRTFERRIGNGAQLWDGDGGIKAVVESKLDELGVPREKITPELLAEKLGFVKPKRKRIRRAG